MFHVELRQFPHMARAFNLTREELEQRFLSRWVAGNAVELNDRRWTPDRARIAIYEGPALRAEEIGLGRGWANATRTGEDVTQRMLAEARQVTEAPPAVEELKEEIVARCATGPIGLREVIELAGERYPRLRASGRLALAERAVWELLHRGSVRLRRAGAPLDEDQWQPVLLAWSTWAEAAGEAVCLEAAS